MPRLLGFAPQAKNEKAQSLYIYDYIDELGVEAQDMAPAIRASSGPLDIRINSGGGYVSDGVAIFNAIYGRRAGTTAYIDGKADSIAALIPRAAERVIIAPNARMMLHTAAGGGCGYFKPNELKSMLSSLEVANAQILASYAMIEGVDVEKIKAIIDSGEDRFITPEEAVALGLADEIAADPVDTELMAKSVVKIMARRHDMPKETVPIEPKDEPVARVTEQPTAPPTPDPIAAERSRVAGIMAAATPFASRDGIAALRDTAITSGTDAAAFATALLAELGKAAEPVAGSGSISGGTDERDKRRGAMTTALLARAGMAKTKEDKAQLQGNPYVHDSLLDMARDAIGNAMARGRGRDEVFASAITSHTSDFPVILLDAMHKAMDSGYRLQSHKWRMVARVGSVSDFRDHHRIRTGLVGNLRPLRENGEYETAPLPDAQMETISVKTKGLLVNFSRHMMVNDDLSIFPMLFDRGHSAARTIEADFWTYFNSNPVLSDSVALWDAAHNNIGTAGVPSIELIDEARQGMAKQESITGNGDFLDIIPGYAICSLALGSRFRTINAQEYNDESNKRQNAPNIVRGMFGEVIDTPRITTAKKWWMIANPNEGYGVFEVAFLNGNENPFLDQHEPFTSDGMILKVRHDYGMKALDYRGIWYNNGE